MEPVPWLPQVWQPPWSFCRADTQEGAEDFMRSVERRPLAEHDALTQSLVGTYGADVADVRRGAQPSVKLKARSRFMRTGTLDESAGEGYHRSTHHTKQRAPGASRIYIKHTTRLTLGYFAEDLRLPGPSPPGPLGFEGWPTYTFLGKIENI